MQRNARSAVQPPSKERRTMSQPDTDYFVRRAETQLRLAQAATMRAVAAAHYRIACAYLERTAASAATEDRRAQQAA